MINLEKFSKSRRHQYLILKQQMTLAVRKQAPVDTGNLKRNAIYSYKTNYGFNVVASTTLAYYIPYVNEPSPERMANSERVKHNKGFIDRGASDAIAIANNFGNNGGFTNLNDKGKFDRINKNYNMPLFIADKKWEERVAFGYGSYYQMNQRLQQSLSGNSDNETLKTMNITEIYSSLKYDIGSEVE
jgi:hypothetical protein